MQLGMEDSDVIDVMAQMGLNSAAIVSSLCSYFGDAEVEMFGSDKKWKRAVDQKKRRIYYWNVDTREVRWTLPE